MKFAETPSSSAGLIISVFGVASSPIACLARKSGAFPGRCERTREGWAGQGAPAHVPGGRASAHCPSSTDRTGVSGRTAGGRLPLLRRGALSLRGIGLGAALVLRLGLGLPRRRFRV